MKVISRNNSLIELAKVPFFIIDLYIFVSVCFLNITHLVGYLYSYLLNSRLVEVPNLKSSLPFTKLT